MTVLGPKDPRALTGKARDEAVEYTKRWNEEWLGIKPLTAKQQAAKQRKLDAILAAIGYKEDDDA